MHTEQKNHTRCRTLPAVLTIAGSDSSGGAGIQADLKTFLAQDVYGMSAITALTAQNTTGVHSTLASSAEFLKDQLDAVFEDIRPGAVKIGMVANAEQVDVITACLSRHNAKNIVLDPVMVATSRATLADTGVVTALVEKLFSRATLITPNLHEARALLELAQSHANLQPDGGEHSAGSSDVLSNVPFTRLHLPSPSPLSSVLSILEKKPSEWSEQEMERVAECIGTAFQCSVVLKGGHRKDCADDVLYEYQDAGMEAGCCGVDDACEDEIREGKNTAPSAVTWFRGKRIENPNTHGTGCTLSSAIAANLAKGFGQKESIARAKHYLGEILKSDLDLGVGSGPLDHGYLLRSTHSSDE